jgi:hypothetical protein
MKAYVDGMRSLLYYVAFCEDMSLISDSEEEKEKLHGLMEVLIPIAKGYVTDRSVEVCSQAMQVYGGYGYIKEYPVEQLFRDCRITPIYEGTNGIQAMDLLGRKLGMKKGKSVMDLFGEMTKTITAAKEQADLADLAARVETAVNKFGEVAMHMGKTAMSDKVLVAFSNACPFMEVAGDVVVAWMLLWRASVATTNMEKKKKDAAFYKGQVKGCEYFANSILPITMGKMEAILLNSTAAVDIEDASFSG